jgi:putative FmdB family regulatory protein
MPTYDYICKDCGYKFEQFQSIKARPLRKCPVCKKASLKRLIGSGSGLIFKGTGFYETDYRSKSYKEAEKKERNSGKEKKVETKDSKVADKPGRDTKNKKKST